MPHQIQNHVQKPTKPFRKAQVWARRSVHLKTYLQELPRRLRLDIEALVKIFLTRRSLLLKLTDNYLVKLWECSRATVQRRLEHLEQQGLLKRMTYPPKKQADGTWKQERRLVLILPKKTNPSLVSHFGSQANSQQDAVADNSTVVSTSTRNFPNRLGKGANVYLASAELAAITAIEGSIPNKEKIINL